MVCEHKEMTLQERKQYALAQIEQMSEFEIACLCDYLEIWPGENDHVCDNSF